MAQLYSVNGSVSSLLYNNASDSNSPPLYTGSAAHFQRHEMTTQPSCNNIPFRPQQMGQLSQAATSTSTSNLVFIASTASPDILLKQPTDNQSNYLSLAELLSKPLMSHRERSTNFDSAHPNKVRDK